MGGKRENDWEDAWGKATAEDKYIETAAKRKKGV